MLLPFLPFEKASNKEKKFADGFTAPVSPLPPSPSRISNAELFSISKTDFGLKSVLLFLFTKNGFDIFFCVERLHVVQPLAYADVADGQAEFASDGYGDAAFGGSVELG